MSTDYTDCTDWAGRTDKYEDEEEDDDETDATGYRLLTTDYRLLITGF